MRGLNAVTVVLALAAGAVSASGQGDRQATPGLRHVQGQLAGSIYFNIATGERIMTSDRRVPRDLTPIWIADNTDPCDTGTTVGIVSDAADETADDVHVSWGDIPRDSVIDCLIMDYGTDIADIDADMDGIGDGVPGFNMQVVVFEDYPGFDACCGCSLLTSFALTDLPGALDAPPGQVDVYELVIDLASDFVDDDGNPVDLTLTFDGLDIDGDGLADFGYGFGFEQPAVGGGIAGNRQVAPTGNALPDAQGLEDAVDIYGSPDGIAFGGDYTGTFNFGGLDCDAGIPFAQIGMQLFGLTDNPFPCGGDCPAADFVEPFGELDFFDVQAFLTLFSTQDPCGDFNHDGLFDFFDVQAFLAAFSAGCP